MPTNKKTITFETKCWENDWESIIKNGGYQRKLLSFKDNQFDKKILIINNVNDVALVCSEADKLVKQQIIDEWFLVDDYKEEVLNYFNIDFNSFKGGYYYSISELVSIYLSNISSPLFSVYSSGFFYSEVFSSLYGYYSYIFLL